MSGLLNSLKKAAASGSQRNDAPGVSDFSPEMRFSIEPLPGESGFSQWHSAMKMVSQLPEGIPSEFRRRLWLSLADRHLSSRSIDWSKVERNCFSEWSHPTDAELGVQIVKDLHRTGCSLFCGKDGQENQVLLKRVLLAYARWNKAVGYCQGFNMLAALMLQVTEKCESDALKLMIYLIEGVLPDSYFADSLRGLSVDMAVFRELLRTKLPKLSRHLDTLQVASKEGTTSYEPPLTNVFTMQWFLTLFCNCLPQPTVLRVWDLILLEGNEILLRTSLAIWQVLADRILTVRSADEFYCLMGVLMREILEYDLIDANTLVKGIVQIGPLAELRNLREHYLYNITPWVPPSANPERRLKVYPKERLMLDIGVLKKQYTKLKQRQRQAHIIFNTAVARQTARPPPVAMNHLLLGKSALVPARRLGPPKGAVPPARQPAQIPKTIHWKDAPSSSSSSSSSSSDTELCDEPAHSSSSSTTEGEDMPDDNLPSDKVREDNTDAPAVPDVVGDNQIQGDIFDTETSDLYNCLERSDSVVSEDGFDFEKFLEERVRNLKEKASDSEDSVEDTSEMERIKYARKNSQRALEIIQENSLILHRILQTCQTRLSPTPPSLEQRAEVPEETTPTNEDPSGADFPACHEGLPEADYNLEKYRVKLGSPLMDDEKVEDLVEYSSILRFIKGEEKVDKSEMLQEVNKAGDLAVDTTAVEVDCGVVDVNDLEDMRPTAVNVVRMDPTMEANISDDFDSMAVKLEGVLVNFEMEGMMKSQDYNVDGALMDSETAGVDKLEVLKMVAAEFKVDPEVCESRNTKMEPTSIEVAEFKVEKILMDPEVCKSRSPKMEPTSIEVADFSAVKVSESLKSKLEPTAIKVGEDLGYCGMVGVDKSEEPNIALIDSEILGVENSRDEKMESMEAGVNRSEDMEMEYTTTRASNSGEDLMDRADEMYVPYSSVLPNAEDATYRANLNADDTIDCRSTIKAPSLSNESEAKSHNRQRDLEELMRFSLSYAEAKCPEVKIDAATQNLPVDQALQGSKIDAKVDELIVIGKDSKYNSILAYSRDLDEKFNSLILQSRGNKLPLKFTYSLDDTRVSPSWTAVSKSEPPSQKSPISPIELLSPTLSDEFDAHNVYRASDECPSPSYQKSPVSPILESPRQAHTASPSYRMRAYKNEDINSGGTELLNASLESPNLLKSRLPEMAAINVSSEERGNCRLGLDEQTHQSNVLENLRSGGSPKKTVNFSSEEHSSQGKPLSPRYIGSEFTSGPSHRTLSLETDEGICRSKFLTSLSADSPEDEIHRSKPHSYLAPLSLEDSIVSNKTTTPETDDGTYQDKPLPITSPEKFCGLGSPKKTSTACVLETRGKTYHDKPSNQTSPEILDYVGSPTKTLKTATEAYQYNPSTPTSSESLHGLGSPTKKLSTSTSPIKPLGLESDEWTYRSHPSTHRSPDSLYCLGSPTKALPVSRSPYKDPSLESEKKNKPLSPTTPERSHCSVSPTKTWTALRSPNEVHPPEKDVKTLQTKPLPPTSPERFYSLESPTKSLTVLRSPNEAQETDEKSLQSKTLTQPCPEDSYYLGSPTKSFTVSGETGDSSSPGELYCLKSPRKTVTAPRSPETDEKTFTSETDDGTYQVKSRPITSPVNLCDLGSPKETSTACALETHAVTYRGKPTTQTRPESLYCVGSSKKTFTISGSPSKTPTLETALPKTLYCLESPLTEELPFTSYLTYPNLKDLTSRSPDKSKPVSHPKSPERSPQSSQLKSPSSPRLECTGPLKYPTSPKNLESARSPNLESPSYPKSPTRQSLDSPSKVFNPFPVTIHSRQNKEVAVRLGLYKK